MARRTAKRSRNAPPAPANPRDLSPLDWYTIGAVAGHVEEHAAKIVRQASNVAQMARKPTAISPDELPIVVGRARVVFEQLGDAFGDLERLSKAAGQNPKRYSLAHRPELHNRRPYRVELDAEEKRGLDYIADRYGYADTLAARLVELDDPASSPGSTVYGMREHEGWEFADAVDAEDGWMPLAGGELARKLAELYSAIRDERPTTVNPAWRNPDTGTARLHVTEARAHLREASRALEPNPRGLVQLGQARQLDVTIADDGGAVRRYRWTLGDDWRTLTPAGAEQLAAGAGRLFLVPPPKGGSSEPPADSAGVRTFVEWHQFEPREAFSTDVPTVADFGTRLGTAREIVYRSDKWQPGEPLDYEHQFKPSEPPDVFIIGTAEHPRSVLVRGGAFRVTSRGLVD